VRHWALKMPWTVQGMLASAWVCIVVIHWLLRVSYWPYS